MSGGQLITRFTIEKSETGEMVCTDFFPSYDPQGEYENAVCGPKTELAEALLMVRSFLWKKDGYPLRPKRTACYLYKTIIPITQ